MKFFSEKDGLVYATCEHCKKILEIKQEQAFPNRKGFSLNPPEGITCVCGTVHHNIIGKPVSVHPPSTCRKCGYDVALTEKVCPSCGTDHPAVTKTELNTIILIIVTVILLIVGIFVYNNLQTRATKEILLWEQQIK
jgi:predicted nucleic acid-binding Zn ribbon protein